MLWLITLDAGGPRRVEGVPVRLEYGYTRPADRGETRELARLLADRCAGVGTGVEIRGGRLLFSPGPPRRPR